MPSDGFACPGIIILSACLWDELHDLLDLEDLNEATCCPRIPNGIAGELSVDDDMQAVF